MFELQKIFLLLKFFNQISCNNSLKAKISCFFLCFLFNLPKAGECSRNRKQKTASFLMSHRLKKYKNLKKISHMGFSFETQFEIVFFNHCLPVRGKKCLEFPL